MRKRNTVYRSKELWQELIAAWEASNIPQKRWCKENAIPHTSFWSALRRFKGKVSSPLNRLDFIKIPSQKTEGLQLSYKGLSINLSSDFDEIALKRFLKVVEQLAC